SCTGDHFDFWMHPIPENAAGCGGGWNPEIDIGEEPAWDPSQDAAQTYAGFGIANCDEPGGAGVIDTGVDLSAGVPKYGMYWKDDGSGPYGSMEMYLDGVRVSGPVRLSSSATNMANGIYMFLSLDNDGSGDGNGSCRDWQNNPTYVRYVRVWQAR